MMEGGPSHIDTFDPKPELTKRHLQKFKRSGEAESAMSSGERYFVKSPFEFEKAGKSGADISSEWIHLKKQVDDICFYRGAQVDSVNHPTACYQLDTGNRFGGDPGIGSWVTYGLGCETDNLPAFVVMSSGSKGPSGGAANFNSGFLPSVYDGVQFRSVGDPVLYLSNPKGIRKNNRKAVIDAINELNQRHFEAVGDPEIQTRIAAYEMSTRMQEVAPEVTDISREPKDIQELYGAEPGKRSFANNALLARRLVERGVRFVELFHESWDQHGALSAASRRIAKTSTKPAPPSSRISNNAACSTTPSSSSAANSVALP